jgi:hypothetical protein
VGCEHGCGYFWVLPLFHCIFCKLQLFKGRKVACLITTSYNSAVYSSIYARDYVVFMATEDMLNNTSPDSFVARAGSDYNYTAAYMHASALASNLTRLEVSDCMNAYATTFQTSYGSLILVTNNTGFTGTSFYDESTQSGGAGIGCTPDPFGWICGNQRFSYCFGDTPQGACSLGQVDATNWKPFGSKVDYCLSESVQQRCRVQFTPQIAYTVIAFNFAKSSILLFTFLFIKENPLMTVGDAVASFLRRRDETTRSLCLMSKEDISWWQRPSAYPLTPNGPAPRPLQISTKRWAFVVSRRRWATVLLL